MCVGGVSSLSPRPRTGAEDLLPPVEALNVGASGDVSRDGLPVSGAPLADGLAEGVGGGTDAGGGTALAKA